MTEPVTNGLNLIIPNTGDLVAAWGTSALNPNFSVLDAKLSGTTTITLSSATTITLTATATTGVATTTIPQTMNAMIKFTGTQSGNAVIKLTNPGFYIFQNGCISTTSYYVQLSPVSGGGNSIGLPPGRKTHVFFDGTDVDFANPPEPASALDLHGATSYLPWMGACTVKPYLIKDGSTYSTAIYPALASLLGSTFGGNGATTFGVPDERARARIALDTASIATGTYAGRLTAAGSGVNGTTMGAAGGSEFSQAHDHGGLTGNPTTHPVTADQSGQAGTPSGSGSVNVSPASNTDITLPDHLHTIATSGAGNSQNMIPSIVSFLPLIKT